MFYAKESLRLFMFIQTQIPVFFRQPFKVAKPVFFRLVRWRKAKCFVSEVKRGYSEAKSEALT